MTRINANISPEHLVDQHLVAEYREIVRIPNAVRKNGFDAGRDYPDSFRLGTGHVLYFYDKMRFLHRRFIRLTLEMDRRCIKNNISESDVFGYFSDPKSAGHVLYTDIADEDMLEANRVVTDRILDRISTMKRLPTICGKPVGLEEYAKTLRDAY